MIRISNCEFKRIRRSIINIRSLNLLSYPRGMLFTILTQKKVDYVKKFYPKALDKLDEIEKFWKKEGKYPPWLKLTPVMRVRLLLKSHSLSKSAINKILNDPYEVHSEVESSMHPEKLEKVIWNSIYTDYVYSPLAVVLQRARGKLGEEILKEWLEKNNIEFKTEKDMRGKFSKTPDFFFEESFNVDGTQINWIESKALFGDLRTHRLYAKKQFDVYKEMFGEGYVVYWFGCLSELKDNILSTDLFKSNLKSVLDDMIVYTTGRKEKIEHIANAVVIDVSGDLDSSMYVEFNNNIYSREFLEGIKKVIDCYSKGRILIVDNEANWRKSIRKKIGRILHNMGFAVLHF